MENLIIGVNQEYIEPCVFTLYVGVLRQVTRYSNVASSFLPQPTLLAESTITHRLVIFFCLLWRCDPMWVMASSFLMFF